METLKDRKELEEMTIIELNQYKDLLWNTYPQKSILNTVIKYICITNGNVTTDISKYYEVYEYEGGDCLLLRYKKNDLKAISMVRDCYTVFHGGKCVYDSKQKIILPKDWIKSLMKIYNDAYPERKTELVDLLDVL